MVSRITFMMFLALLAVLTSSACTHQSIVGNQQVLEELERVGALAQEGTLTVGELAMLDALTSVDHDAEHGMSELHLMVQYQEWEHAGHAIGFLSAYVQTGEEALCPGHDLAHYYVLSRHGETDEAMHALEHAEDHLRLWERKAKAYTELYPAPRTVEEISSIIDAHLTRISSGDSTATEEEVRFLATETLCVSS